MQVFEVNECDTFTWVYKNGSVTEDSGTAVAEANNCVTAPGLLIEKDTKRTLTFTLLNKYDGTSTCEQSTAKFDKNSRPEQSIGLYAMPMPFNSRTSIYFRIPPHSSRLWGSGASRAVIIKVFDIQGNLVKTLVNDVKNRGSYRTVWNGSDQRGRSVSAGLYLIRMNAGDMQRSMKVVLSR
jgi:hypothetical protein